VILTPLSVKRTPEANADLGGDARVHSLFWNDLRFMSSINVRTSRLHPRRAATELC
jgi:amidase